MIALFILGIVLVLITVRQVGRFRLHIWQIMLGGAILSLITQQITLVHALYAINIDVMVFLFCMFLIGHALEESGYLSFLGYTFFQRALTTRKLLFLTIFSMGIASAFLMNDTLAIIGTPLVLLLAREHRAPPKVFLLALCFAITIGSAMSPIGNPQNLLIAVNSSMEKPFIAFLFPLLIPTLINLYLAYLLLCLFYRQELHDQPLTHVRPPESNRSLALVESLSLLILITMIAAKILLGIILPTFQFPLMFIALVSITPLLLSRERFSLMKGIDWSTLIFFASMFILMQAVWDTGLFQRLFMNSTLPLTSPPMIISLSLILSQLISNVPLVALYQPLLMHAGISQHGLLLLAVSSTIAGNLLILGAASNVIIIQNAEKRSKETITTWEFARVGIPLTFLNILVYLVFLNL